jgi:hypothetical protein
VGLLESYLAQYGDLTPRGLADLPAYIVAFLAAFPAMLMAIWIGSRGVTPPARLLSVCGVTVWAYLVGVALPLCWGTLIESSPCKVDPTPGLAGFALLLLVTPVRGALAFRCGWRELLALTIWAFIGYLLARLAFYGVLGVWPGVLN